MEHILKTASCNSGPLNAIMWELIFLPKVSFDLFPTLKQMKVFFWGSSYMEVKINYYHISLNWLEESGTLPIRKAQQIRSTMGCFAAILPGRNLHV